MTDAELVRTKEWQFAMGLVATLNRDYQDPADLLDSLDEIELVAKFEDELGIVIHDDDLPPLGSEFSLGQLVRLVIETSCRPKTRSIHA
jgi:acyl carrier protein